MESQKSHVSSASTKEFSPHVRPVKDLPPRVKCVSLAIFGLGLMYTLYRAYYAFGGTLGMVGTVTSQSEWRAINLAGAAILLVLSMLPLVALPLWRYQRLRWPMLAICWLLTVGFVGHAVIDDAQRVLSLAGVIKVDYPSLWATIDRRSADIQDLIFNETWFLVEGLLWGALGWIWVGSTTARRWWTGTGVVAVLAISTIGMLSVFGVIGKAVIF